MSVDLSSFLKRHILIGLSVFCFGLAMVHSASSSDQPEDTIPELYVVNFTADWCPNCRILDPALEEALSTLDTPQIDHIVFDLTDADRTRETFEKINGTILGGVYGDHIGVTGLVVMVAADSGETVDCATRIVDASGIRASILNALERVQTTQPGQRGLDSYLCPPPNKRILVN